MLTRRTNVLAMGVLVLSLAAGCANNDNVQQQPAQPIQTELAEQAGQTSTVVNKTTMSDKFLVEISGSNTHEYIEVTERIWNRIAINDTVAINADKEIVSINNSPL